LENKKKVFEFDLEGVRLAIQKKGQIKFEVKIVLDNLKKFSYRLREILTTEKSQKYYAIFQAF